MRIIFLFLISFNVHALDVSRLQAEMDYLVENKPMESEQIAESQVATKQKSEKEREAQWEKSNELVEDVEGQFFGDEISTHLASPTKAFREDRNDSFRETENETKEMDEI